MKSKDYKYIAILILTHIFLMLTAGIVLIYAFEFPDILRKDMEDTLGLFHQNAAFTVPAYYLFTITGISFMMVVLMLFRMTNGIKVTSGFLAVVFGVLFGLTSSLGFIRWPFLMNHLGNIAATANPEKMEMIRLIYDSFHIYAGVSIGENFAFWFEFLWMFLFSSSIIQRGSIFPTYLGRVGQLLGIGMLIYSLEQFGGFFSVLGPLNMLVHTAQLGWFLGLAFALFNVNTDRHGRLTLVQRITSAGLFLLLSIISFT